MLKLALDKDDQVMRLSVPVPGQDDGRHQEGRDPNEAYEKNIGTYGRFKAEDGAVKWIDPRKQ